jgi:hypothetical protein
MGGTYNMGVSDGKSHVCNCIGCCRICGQCRTAPWHAASCARIAALNERRAEIIREVRGQGAPAATSVDHVSVV